MGEHCVWIPGVESRILLKLRHDPETGCVLWTGARSRGQRCGGYGSVWDRGSMRQVHRVVWEQYKRKGKRLPSNITVDHVKARGCVNILCCNVWDHLQPVTRSTNNRRSTCHHHPAFKARQQPRRAA